MLAENSFVAEPTRPTVVITRTFNAPRDLVFEALTKPEHIARWWGPKRLTVAVCEIDLRVGGVYRFVHRAEDGTEYPFKGVYREITPPERLIYTQRYDVEPYAKHESVVTVDLAERDARTTLTIIERFASLAERDAKMKQGMRKGALESVDRLGELLGVLGAEAGPERRQTCVSLAEHLGEQS
jgi:uncharacterized protein YndB with AHSA1/START domain